MSKTTLVVSVESEVREEFVELARELGLSVDEFAEVCLAVGVTSYRHRDELELAAAHSVALPLARPERGPSDDGGRAA